MAAPPDLVRVEKRLLRFQVPHTSDVSSIDTLTVTNISSSNVAFKVKTTNQQRYIVRPNVGVIQIGDTVDIDIGLQLASATPRVGPSKDKFLLRVAAAPQHLDAASLADFWTALEGDAGVRGFKFKVEFFSASDDAQAPVSSPPPDASRYVIMRDPDELLQDDKYALAMSRVRELQQSLEAKNLELVRLKTELAETKAETERVLRDAPTTPLSANKVVSDPFGGVSIVGLGLMLLLFLILVNVILRIL